MLMIDIVPTTVKKVACTSGGRFEVIEKCGEDKA